jgi:hypothetical protein
MESDKPKILLVWGYHRKGWVDVFNKLAPFFRFELLFYLEKPENEANFTDFPTHYWLEYRSARELIDTIRPDKVVFMSTEGLPPTALNAVCKKRGIRTSMLQHGMFQPYENYLMDVQLQTQRAARLGKNDHNKKNDRGTNLQLLKFYLRSFTFPSVIPAFQYLVKLRLLKRKHFEIEALRLLPSKLRLADDYVVFTKYNNSFLVLRDGVKDEQFVVIGNPEFDEYTAEKNREENYYLYIHSPLTYLPEWDSEGFMSQEQENECLRKMNAFALSQNCRMYVKLHPYSYDNPDFYRHDNLVYLKDADNAPLIMQAKGVFGFNSTLILPAAYFKNTCLFTLGEFSHIQEDLGNLGVVTLLPFHECTIEELQRAMETKSDRDTDGLLEKYLYRMDGLALGRLKQYLLNGARV